MLDLGPGSVFGPTGTTGRVGVGTRPGVTETGRGEGGGRPGPPRSHTPREEGPTTGQRRLCPTGDGRRRTGRPSTSRGHLGSRVSTRVTGYRWDQGVGVDVNFQSPRGCSGHSWSSGFGTGIQNRRGTFPPILN